MTAPGFTKHQVSDHGWVYPNADGRRSPCGGPAICTVCAADKAALDASRMFAEEIQAHQYDEPYNVMAQLLDAMKGQLLIVLVNRLGGKVEIPVAEVDGTGQFMLAMSVDQARGVFTFEARKKS